MLFCPEKPSNFKSTIQHLINCHRDDEMRVRQFEGCQMWTINFKAFPDHCGEQGKTITIYEINEKIHISKAKVVPKDR